MAVVLQIDENEYAVKFRPTSAKAIFVTRLRTGKFVGDSLFTDPPDWAVKAVKLFLKVR